MKPRIWRCFSLLVLASLLLSGTGVLAATPQPPAPNALAAAESVFTGVYNEIPGATDPALYIVRLKDPALASYFGGIPGLEATSPRATGAAKLDPASPASVAYLAYLEVQHTKALTAVERAVGRPVEMTFQYLAALNGFAITLTPDEAAKVAQLPEVLAVYRDVERELDTDVGPIHIGAPAIWDGDTGAGVATRGEGVIIGVIDSGINSQHPSFAAADGDGYTHTNPYGAGVYKGWCVANPGFCNAKLIAAYGLNPVGGSPEDDNGHGSHTASTAGGNKHTASFNVGPTPYNIELSGVAPRANIVAYKVCTPSCPGSASVAAVNSAILNDQVDVLNYSISGSDSPWNDPVDIAFLDATNAGIFVSASAGNAGPGPSTVAKTGPWNAAVAASTINRVIAHTLDVTGPTIPPALQGMAAVPGENTVIAANINGPLKYDSTNNTGCTAFSVGFFTGSLALIQRGGCTFAVKVTNAANAGATGVVIFNSVGGPPISMGGLTGAPPAVMLDLADGIALRDYVLANPASTTVRINTATSYLVEDAWEDIVAGFSSRGPSQYELLKPDYIAPGVNILAATMTAPGNPAQYEFMQGTSMSSPHGAGAAALMVALHPTWSPAEIKSAMASTAVGGLLKEDGATPADPFDVGSGLLDLSLASTTGLVFDETYANYVAANPALGGDPKTLNQPSMVSYNCAGTCTWTRTVKSTLPISATYTAATSGPAGMIITVTPNSFTIPAGGTQVLQITADVSALPLNAYAFGAVTLQTDAVWPDIPVSDNTLPVVVRPTDAVPDINVTPTSLAATQLPDTSTSQILTIANVGTAPLIWTIDEAPLAMRIELSLEGGNAINAPIMLAVDDGVGENAIGLTDGGQFLWLNRFSPTAGQFPVVLDRVDIMFGYPGATGGVNVGELVDIYLYEDADGNPANGATHRASLLGQAVQAVDGATWSTYNLAAPVSFSGPGDILIAVVNRTAGVAANTFPAVIDQSSPSQQRSWAGFGAVPGNPPVLPLPTFALIDSFGLPGNWLVRGFGEANAACDNPADVPWLTVAPTGGTTAGGGSAPVTIGFDSTGLALGTYNAVLCVASNDPDTPLVEVPVSLTVGQPGNVVTICRTPNVPIPDNNPTGVSDTITVADDLTILDFNVYIRATHTWVGDLRFVFEHVDSATSVTLIDRPGVPATTFGCSGDNYDVWVDDEGTDTPIENQCANLPAITGRAIGGDPPNASLLTAFDGLSTQGDWVLTAIDNASGDTGTLVEWCVEVTYEEPATALICNAPTEGFDSGIPAGWSVQTNEPNGPQWTSIAGCGEAGNFTNGTGEAACVSSDLFGPAEMDTSLVTPMFDLTGFGAASLSYTVNYQNFANSDFLDVDISADGGATWTTLLSWNDDFGAFRAQPGVDVAINLSAYAGQSGLMLRWRYYDPNTADWNWYAQVDDVALSCVEGEVPNIDVDPLSLSSTQPADATTQQTLTIANTGEGMLDWEIDEEDTTVFPTIEVGELVAQPAAEVAGAPEPAGAAIAAAGKQEFWRAPDAILHDNGPLVTHPGGGFGGADASALQGSLGLNTFGFGHAVASGFRVADDFTVPAGPGWMIDTITFFAYQTGSTTVSTINAVNLRIWDGPPGQPGSNIVFGDTSTNLLSNTAFINAYRVTETDLLGSTRPIMASTATLNTYLAPGTYWVDWQTGGTLASGPWAPAVSILGQTAPAGANAVQYSPTADAWSPLVDTGTAQAVQDLPFIIRGEEGAPECAMLSDIPWLSLDVTAGSNAGGASTDVTVTFDSTGLVAGTYTGNLCVFSNDPDPGPGNGTELVIVPVELIVEESNAVVLTALAAGSPSLWSGIALLGVFTLGGVVYRRKRR